MTPTPVGMRCPECSHQRTPVRTMRDIRAPRISATLALVAINVVVFIASAVSAGGLAAFNATDGSLVQHGALDGPAIAIGHQYWRLVTAGFLHASIPHVLFNMLSLYFLGMMLEPAIGRGWFLAVYGVSLLTGSLGALLVTPNALTLGASGAVFGIAGAALVVMRARGLSLARSGLPLFLALNLILGFSVVGISIGGHIGGLIGGVLTGALIVELSERRRARALAAAGCLALAAVAVAASLLVAHSALPTS